MTTQNTNRRLATIVGIAAPTLLVANLGFAAWNASGVGQAQAEAGTATDLTVVADTVTTGLLYPTLSGDVFLAVTNPNPYAVEVTDVVFGTFTVAGAIGTCTTTGVTFTNASGLTDVVAAGATVNLQLVDAVSMDNTSDDGCQQATFTPVATVTGVSSN